jgi:Ca2+-binding RTX toxin-like protein
MATQFNNLYLASGGTLALAFGTSATKVYGSVDADTVTISAGVTVVLDGSFNRGNDTIKFSGNAASYTIVRVNASTVRVTDADGTSVTIPVGSAGTKIEFADATRTLSGSSAGIILGNQSVTATPLALAAGAAPAPVESYTLSVNAASVTEGDTGSKTLSYKLTLDKAPTSSVTVNYETLETGTATANDDFVPVAGTVTFAAGQTVAFVSVTVLGDTNVEAPETIKLNLSGSKLVASVEATGTVVDNETAPVDPTSYTVTAADISNNNAITGNNSIAVNVGSTGDKTVALQSDGVTSDGGYVISGSNANITVNAGVQGDTITVVSNGNNVVNAGAGSGTDSVTVIGTGSNQINVGGGNDTVVGGSGNDTITFASGELKAGDSVDGGAGTDTVVLSGDGNVIGGAGATIANVENLVLQGTKVTITGAALTGLQSITGSSSTSEVTVDVAAGDRLDLSAVNVGTLKSITADDNVTLVLTAGQIAQLGSIKTAAGKNLTVVTDAAGLQALGTKAAAGTGGTLGVQVSDTAANIQANAALIASTGATPLLSSPVTVAEALASLAVAPTVNFDLRDTAANLALAPVVVYNKSLTVTATTAATAAEATQINKALDVSTFAYTAAKVTINVTDTASNLANYYVESDAAIEFDTVTATTAATAAEAIAIKALNSAAVYAIRDTAANLDTNKAQSALDTATSITVSDVANITQISAVNTASDVDVAKGYAINDDFDDLTSVGNASVANNAGNMTITDANDADVSVAEALVANNLTNSGTKSYLLNDSIGALLAANSTTVANTSTVKVTDATITAAQASSLFSKFGAAKIADTDLVIADTAANLLTLSSAIMAETKATNGVVIIGNATASLADIIAIKTAATGNRLDLSTVKISDSVSNLTAAVADTTKLALLDGIIAVSGTVGLSDAATVAQAAALNTALAGELNGTFAISDTAQRLIAASAGEGLNAVQDAASIAVTNATSMSNINDIKTASGLTAGTTLTYSLSDAAATIITDANSLRAGATSIAITDASVTGDQAVALKGYTNFNGIYAINDSYDEILGAGKNVGLTSTILNAATSVTITDNVSNLQANSSAALTAIAASTTVDRLVISDTLSALNGAASDTKSAASAFRLTNSVANGNEITAGDVTTVNALTGLKSTTYTVTDILANLVDGTAAKTPAIGTMLSKATTVQIGGDVGSNNTLVLAALSVSQFNTLDALTPATIYSALEDTIANLADANAASAVSNTLANSSSLTISDINSKAATVVQAETLVARGVTITGLDIADTAAALQNMNEATWTAMLAGGAGNTVKVSDNGSLTDLSVAQATRIYSADGSQYANYTLKDTAAAIVASLGTPGLVNFATAVTVSDSATLARAITLAGATTFGTPIRYSVTVAAADDLTAIGVAAALNSAVNVVASDAQSVADARILNDATNSGTTSYSISGAASAFTDASNAVRASIASAVNAATGTVTATVTATVAEAEVIAAFTKAVTYSVSGSAAALFAASASARNEAVDVTVTDTATVTQANAIMASTNSGTTTIATVSGNAASVEGLVIGSNDVVTNVTVTGNTSAAAAAAIKALDTGPNITNTIVFANISGSATEIAALGNATLAAVTGLVTVSSAMTVAEYNTLAAAVTIANVDRYTLADSFTNLMVNSDATGVVNANAAIAGATSVTVTDTALTLAQADIIDGINAGKIVYTVRDTDANIVAALNGNGATETALLAASKVYSANGDLLSIKTIGAAGTLNVISGTKAQIDALSAVLKTADVAYEVTVADLEANPNFYSTLAGNQHISVSGTVAQLKGGNALLPLAKNIVVTDAASMADATTIRALSASDSTVYNLRDTAVALVAGTVLNEAVNIEATDAATEAQAEVIIDAQNSGTVTYDIRQVDTGVAAATSGAGNNEFAAAVNAYDGARNITIAGTTGIDANQAQELLSSTNSGTTVIAKVTGTSAALAALAVGSNDTITAVTPSDAATVDQIVAMKARAGSITSYNLSDTAEKLAAADPSILNGATDIGLSSGVATVAQAAIIEAATNTGTKTYQIADTASAILAAPASLLGKDANNSVVITDATVSAGVATSLRALDAANNGTNNGPNFAIQQGARTAGNFIISDSSLGSLTAAANATAVSVSTDVRIQGNVSVAQAVAVQTATGTVDGSNKLTYNLVDTYTNLVVNRSSATPLVMTDVSVTVTNNLSVAQARVVAGYNAAAATYSIVDSSANVFANLANTAVTGAASVTLNTAATVAQADAIAASSIKLTGGYDIVDSAGAVFAAYNAANGTAGGDRTLLEGADSLALNTNATVAQVLGGAANSADTEARGLYKITGLTYSVSDTVGNMVSGLAGIDAAGLLNAVALKASNTNAVTVADATLLLSLSNFKGYDDPATGNVTEQFYYLEDSFAAIQGADTALVNGARTVTATGGISNENIDLSMHTKAMTIDGGAGNDTIIGTDAANLIIGGIGNDTLTGGAGTDTFRFAASSNGADVITDFTVGSGGDVLDLSALVGGAHSMTPVSATSTGAISLGTLDEKAVLVSVADVSVAITEADLFGAGKAFAAEGTTAREMVLVVGEASGTDGVKIYQVVDGTGADDLTITLIGTLNGISFDGVVSSNFSFG